MICSEDCIRFPFLSDARHFAKFNILETLNDKQIRDKIDIYLYDIFTKKYHNHENLDIDTVMKRFVGSLIVINHVKKDRCIYKYADVESSYYIYKLRLIYGADKSISKENFFVYFDMIYREIYGEMDIKKTNEGFFYVLTIPRFLSKVSKFRDKESFKLINQQIVRGHVLLDLESLYLFLKQALAGFLVNKIKNLNIETDLNTKKSSKFHPPLVLPDGFKELIKKYEYIDAYNDAYSKPPPPNTDSFDIHKLRDSIKEVQGPQPPCIAKVIDMFQKGESPSHFQRLTLSAYLYKQNYSMEQILEIFSNAPNYDEKITRYQLQQIKSKDYMVSSCSSIEQNGFCFRNSVCGKIKNPIQLLSNR